MKKSDLNLFRREVIFELEFSTIKIFGAIFLYSDLKHYYSWNIITLIFFTEIFMIFVFYI